MHHLKPFAALSRALELEPDNAGATGHLGTSAATLDVDCERAIAFWELALTLDPGSPRSGRSTRTGLSAPGIPALPCEGAGTLPAAGCTAVMEERHSDVWVIEVEAP